MKKQILLASSILIILCCRAQQFAYTMTFIDTAGDTDRILLGYDLAATDSIDSAFGELNIITQPYNAGLANSICFS